MRNIKENFTVYLEGLFQPLKKRQNFDPQIALFSLGLFWHFLEGELFYNL